MSKVITIVITKYPCSILLDLLDSKYIFIRILTNISNLIISIYLLKKFAELDASDRIYSGVRTPSNSTYFSFAQNFKVYSM
jgi:hypothetical protein